MKEFNLMLIRFYTCYVEFVFFYGSILAFFRKSTYTMEHLIVIAIHWILWTIVFILIILNVKYKKAKFDILVNNLLILKFFLDLLDFEGVRLT